MITGRAWDVVVAFAILIGKGAVKNAFRSLTGALFLQWACHLVLKFKPTFNQAHVVSFA